MLGFDEFLTDHLQRSRLGDTCELGNENDPYDHTEAGDAASPETHREKSEQNCWEAEHDIDRSHREERDRWPTVSTDDTTRGTAYRRNECRDDCNQHCWANTDEQTRKDIAPKFVSSEPMLYRARLVDCVLVDGKRVVRCNEWPKDRNGQHHEHYNQAGSYERAAKKDGILHARFRRMRGSSKL